MSARLRLACALSMLVLALSGCGGSTGSASSSSRVTASGRASASPSAAQGSGKLDAAVPTPSGFPADMPIYPGARLTAGANFTSSRLVTWGMEWETFDRVDKVQAFYTSKLNQGDWSTSFSGGSNGSFSAVFARKSNSKIGGLIGANSTAGVTTITLSFVNDG